MSEETKYTPGPWEIHSIMTERGGKQMGYIDIKTADGHAICSVFPFAGRGGVGIDTGRANTALIASAPELYDAVLALYTYCDHRPTLDAVDAVLKKARGEA